MRISCWGLGVALLSSACASAPASVGSTRAALLATDTAFSDAAQKIGIGAAFVKYADPQATMMPANQDAVQGLEAVGKQFADLPPGTTLAWKPFRADASASADLGYTLGTYELRLPGPGGKVDVRYGKYCSVWKRQPDGGWKWVVDIGNASPAPKP